MELLVGFFVGSYLGKRARAAKKAAPKAPSPPPLNDEQAQCYLDRYPDLQEAFGDDLNAARRHWNDHGRREGRTHECLPEEE